MAFDGIEVMTSASPEEHPVASNTVSWLSLLLVFIDLLDLTRAWDWPGAHRYRFRRLLKPRRDAEKGKAAPSKDSSE